MYNALVCAQRARVCEYVLECGDDDGDGIDDDDDECAVRCVLSARVKYVLCVYGK